MQRSIETLESGEFDVLVVGAGVQGAWIALRAAEAGCRVALIDRHDFGGATSANSLNILHGGLRYLQHLDFARMRSSIRARREFARQSMRLALPLPCVMPLRTIGIRSPWFLGPALLANDAISFDRNTGVEPAARLPMGRLLSGAACASRVAPLATARASAGALWWDLLSLDSARLVLDTIVAAADAGAVIANRVQALGYLVHDGKVAGIAARDGLTSREFEIRAKVVVNATGPWAGEMSRASGLATDFMPRGWCGGLNLVFRRSLGIETAVALSLAVTETDQAAVVRRDSRELFFVPWRGVTLVGTDYLSREEPHEFGEGPPRGSIESFLGEVSGIAPHARLSAADVALAHWGVLPTEAAGSKLPRKAPIVVSGRGAAGADGLVVVIGEKLTSAPVLSQHVLHLALAEMGGAHGRRRDAGARMDSISSSQRLSSVAANATGEPAQRLAARYGDRWPEVARHADGQSQLLRPIHPDAPVLGVEIVHAIRDEMALGLDDLLLRRLDIGSTGHPGSEVVRRCVEIAAPEWGWGVEARQHAIGDLEEWYRRRRPAGSPSEGAAA
jgi:glycerol-3-phosphate dehydrogenase